MLTCLLQRLTLVEVTFSIGMGISRGSGFGLRIENISKQQARIVDWDYTKDPDLCYQKLGTSWKSPSLKINALRKKKWILIGKKNGKKRKKAPNQIQFFFFLACLYFVKFYLGTEFPKNLDVTPT